MLNKKVQHAKLDWNDQGTPISEFFDDIYFSNINGLEEALHVFIQSNQLPERWQNFAADHFVIAETGFGTGLNFLAAWHVFTEFKQRFPELGPKRLYFTSFEKFPLNKDDLTKALDNWPALAVYAQQLIEQYPMATQDCHRVSFDQGAVILDLWFGDIKDTLPKIQPPAGGLVDCWFLDGFAPSKNPEMWSQFLFDSMARLAKPEASLATFTAAGFVRRGLIDAGFNMRKIPGFGTKREMLAGLLETKKPVEEVKFGHERPAGSGNHVAIIGGGIASASTALTLVRKGFRVSLYCQDAGLAENASGNKQGALYPLLNGVHDELSQFYAAGFEYSVNWLKEITALQPVPHALCGVTQLGYDEKSSKKITNMLKGDFPPELVHPLSADQVTRVAGLEFSCAGVSYPNGGWLNPAEMTRALIAQAQNEGEVTVLFNQPITALQATDNGWQLQSEDRCFEADIAVVAAGHKSNHFPQLKNLAVYPVRGLVSHIPTNSQLQQLNTVVCYKGYIAPVDQGSHCIGASYARNSAETEFSEQDHLGNRTKLEESLPELDWSDTLDFSDNDARVGVRSASRDHLPFVGAVPHFENTRDKFSFSDNSGCVHQNLYMISGLGSRGLCSSALAAELLASQIAGEPLPLSSKVLFAVNPSRQWIRKLRKGSPL